MIIGVPKEIKNHEYRVGLTPRSVKEFINHGHKVAVQTNAGVGIGASDQEYGDCELVLALKYSGVTSAPVALATMHNVVATQDGPTCLKCSSCKSSKYDVWF